jgi:hypothetical protein
MVENLLPLRRNHCGPRIRARLLSRFGAVAVKRRKSVIA